jgi:hypothetical protein
MTVTVQKIHERLNLLETSAKGIDKHIENHEEALAILASSVESLEEPW